MNCGMCYKVKKNKKKIKGKEKKNLRSSDLVIFTFSISLVCALYLLTLMLNYFEEVKKKKKNFITLPL